MMRDKLKTPEYWKKKISEDENFLKIDIDNLKNGKIPNARINIVKHSMSYSFLQSVSAKYSAGYPIIELKEDLLKAIDLTDESWVEEQGIKIYYKNRYLNQFVDYDQMLWMLSLGYLLEIDNIKFKKLVEVIDRHSVKDYLFEFIIRAKIKERKPIIEESYQNFFGIPNLYKKLREAIVTMDKPKAGKLVKEFITKDWYKGHKDLYEGDWGDNHKSEHNIYYGYWSFETAAVVKIMGLDDSSFIDCPYYPKDLVHQEK